jgi:nucleoside-diphosphate-sugar epimerase
VKILIVCPEPLSRVTGGIGTYSRELARTLLEQGNEVEVLTRAPDKQDLVALEESGVTIGRIQISEKIPFNVFPLQL